MWRCVAGLIMKTELKVDPNVESVLLNNLKLEKNFSVALRKEYISLIDKINDLKHSLNDCDCADDVRHSLDQIVWRGNQNLDRVYREFNK
jgi:hypothetical protein